ncbi:MAG: TIGR04076 family protein [Promethearchaeota archaeon]
MSRYKWIEPMKFEMEVIAVDSACRVNHKVGEQFVAEYKTPIPGICGEAFVGMYPLLYAMRVDGDMRQLGKEKKYETNYYCPSRVVKFKIRGIPQCDKCGKTIKDFHELIKKNAPYTIFICEECLKNME